MSRLRIFLAIFIASISLANVLYAQFPVLDSLLAFRPRHLEASFSDSTVHLRWHRPETTNDPSSYKIYRSAGFHLPNVVGAVADTTYDDTTVILRTEYHYAVTAVYHDTIESLPSNIVGIFTGEGDGDHHEVNIEFTTQPPRTALVHHAFTYDADVLTSPPGIPVCFGLKDAPDGMTIDSATGVINWTPERAGSFEVEIIARTCDTLDAKEEQEFRLCVLTGAPGSVAGNVRNGSGEGLSHVTVKLFDVGRGDFVLKTATDDSGHYTFPLVNPTTYFVRALPDNRHYLPEWFNDAQEIANATPVVVPESGAVNADFTLHLRDSIRDKFRLEGFVLNGSAEPLRGAKVFVSLLGHDRWSDERYDDCHDGEGHDGEDHEGDHDDGDHHGGDDHVQSAVTDSNGHYLFVLRGGTYIVGAFARHYLPQYWDHNPSPLEADPIHLIADTSGIDFNLQPIVVATGSIRGHIFYAADSAPAESHVIAFRKDSSGHFTKYMNVTRTDTSGAYAFEHLPDGSYIVVSKDEDDIIPTFYNLSGGTPFLDSATAVTVSGGGAVAGIDIYVPVDSVDGLNSIGGMISLNSTAPGSTVPVAGAIVTILNSDRKVAGSTISEGDGSYLAVGLAPGTYNVLFQKPGVVTAGVQVSVQYQDNTPTTSTMNVRLSEGTGGITLGPGPVTAPEEFMLYQNYPNPFNPTTRIVFDLPHTAQVTLKVYNVIGQEVATLAENATYAAGKHALVLDASKLVSGLYFTKLQAGTYSAVRKMVLIK